MQFLRPLICIEKKWNLESVEKKNLSCFLAGVSNLRQSGFRFVVDFFKKRYH